MRLKILLLVQKNQQKNQNLPNYLGETPNPKFFYKIYRTPGIRIISISDINLNLLEHSIFLCPKITKWNLIVLPILLLHMTTCINIRP